MSSNTPPASEAEAPSVAEAGTPISAASNGAEPPESWAPDPPKPHDNLSFDELSSRYNFRLTSNNRVMITKVVIEACRALPQPGRVLDIGCGRGIGRQPMYNRAIAQHAGEYWGIEPDADVQPEDGLFDNFQHATAEEADLPEDYFDIVYSYMVMEHVEDPESYIRAVHRCLKPGGIHLFITPNARHYFTRCAKCLHRLGLADRMLTLLRGKAMVDDYHYPVRYAFNDAKRIDALSRRIGFDAPQFAYIEFDGPRGYMPGPLRPLFHLLAFKRRIIQRPESLLVIICRMRKPA